MKKEKKIEYIKKSTTIAEIKKLMKYYSSNTTTEEEYVNYIKLIWRKEYKTEEIEKICLEIIEKNGY